MKEVSDQNWQVEFIDKADIVKSLKKLPQSQLLDVFSTVEEELSFRGIDVFKTLDATWVGDGLGEYRYRKYPDLLVRIFFFVAGKTNNAKLLESTISYAT